MRTIHRRSPARNEARFYAVALQADLLAGWTVVWVWWRIGSAGRVRARSRGYCAWLRPTGQCSPWLCNTPLIAASGGGGRG